MLPRIAESGVLLLLGALVLLDARGYPPSLAEGVPGPALFPGLIAVLLILSAFGLLLRRPPPVEREPGGLRAGAAALWITGFLLALPTLGALVALPPLLAGLMWLAGERSPRRLLPIPLAFAAGAWLLFARLLGVALP